MTGVIICFILSVIFAAMLACYITDVVKDHDELDSGILFFLGGMLLAFIIGFFCSFAELKDEIVKDYLRGDIVEVVSYQYTKKDGVIVDKDSTITYKPKK